MSDFLSHIDINNIPWSRPFSLVKTRTKQETKNFDGYDDLFDKAGIYEIGFINFDKQTKQFIFDPVHVECHSYLHSVYDAIINRKQYPKENDLVQKYVESDNICPLYSRYYLCNHDEFRLVDKLHTTFGTGPTGRYAFDTHIDPVIFSQLPNELIIEILDYVPSAKVRNKVQQRFGKRNGSTALFFRHIMIWCNREYTSNTELVEAAIKKFTSSRPCVLKIDTAYELRFDQKFFETMKSVVGNVQFHVVISGITDQNNRIVLRKDANRRWWYADVYLDSDMFFPIWSTLPPPMGYYITGGLYGTRYTA